MERGGRAGVSGEMRGGLMPIRAAIFGADVLLFDSEASWLQAAVEFWRGMARHGRSAITLNFRSGDSQAIEEGAAEKTSLMPILK